MKHACGLHQPFGNVKCEKCQANQFTDPIFTGEPDQSKILPSIPGSITQWCEHFKMLDKVYNHDPKHPLHHDRRCLKCAGLYVEGQPEYMLRSVLANKYTSIRLKDNAGHELARRKQQ